MRVRPMWAWSEVFFAMFARLGLYSGIVSATPSFEYLKNTQSQNLTPRKLTTPKPR